MGGSRKVRSAYFQFANPQIYQHPRDFAKKYPSLYRATQRLKPQLLLPAFLSNFSDLLEALDAYKGDICATQSVLVAEHDR